MPKIKEGTYDEFVVGLITFLKVIFDSKKVIGIKE